MTFVGVKVADEGKQIDGYNRDPKLVGILSMLDEYIPYHRAWVPNLWRILKMTTYICTVLNFYSFHLFK